jgi:hypothetical protein
LLPCCHGLAALLSCCLALLMCRCKVAEDIQHDRR